MQFKKIYRLGVGVILGTFFSALPQIGMAATSQENFATVQMMEDQVDLFPAFAFEKTLENGRKAVYYKRYDSSLCFLDAKIYTSGGELILRDREDLTDESPRKHDDDTKGFQLAFGDSLALSGDVEVNHYFATKSERDFYYDFFSRFHKVCDAIETEIKKERDHQGIEVVYTPGSDIPGSNQENAGEIRMDGTNQGALLKGRLDYYTRLQSAEKAKKSIYLQALSYRADEAGLNLSKMLLKKRMQGLDVRVIMDGMFTMVDVAPEEVIQNTQIMYSNMMAAGIRVWGYVCGDRNFINETNSLEDMSYFLKRIHQKMWVVDGADALTPGVDSSLALVGGINSSFEYWEIEGQGDDNWRDQNIALKGSVVKDVHKDFLINFDNFAYRYTNTYKYDQECFNPYNPLTEKVKFTQFLRRHFRGYLKYVESETKVMYQDMKLKVQNIAKGNLCYGEEICEHYWSTLNFKPIDSVRFTNARPDENEPFIQNAYLTLIAEAKESIVMANSYMTLTDDMKEALQDAVLRGVEVKLLTNSESTTDMIGASIVGEPQFLDIADPDGDGNVNSNIQIRLWDGDDNRRDDYNKHGILHAKFMLVDGKIALIGSYNIGYRSRDWNGESAVIVESPAIVSELTNIVYERDFNYAHLLTDDELKAMDHLGLTEQIRYDFYDMFLAPFMY